MAMRTKIVMSVAETQKNGLRRMARQASEASERSSLMSPASRGSAGGHLGDGGFSHG